MKRLCILGLSTLVLSLACGSEDPADPSPSGGGGNASVTTGAGAGGEGTGGEGGTIEAPTLRTISGDVTWAVTFDEDAKANGNTDCSYTRHYEGVEDGSAQWLCPGCEVMFRADVTIISGLADCYSQVSQNPPSAFEWIGYGGGLYYRGFGGPMSEQGTATVSDTTLETSNQVPSVELVTGGTLAFDVSGSLAIAEADGDPMHGFIPPADYACGWPKADPPAYSGNYAISSAAQVPDGIFKDGCEQTVRLHDFAGDYLLIDMAAIDCPPCQQMASQEEAFVQQMAAQGITVHVITLLAPSLGNPLGETTTAMLNNWTNQFGLTSPVLADRGWGLSMFLPIFEEQTGYPSWVLVAPDLSVLEVGNGFGGFPPLEQSILAHAAK